MRGQVTTETAALWGLVLAGGDGRRLQDLTRAVSGNPIPKQCCRLFHRSLLEMTLDRASGLIAPERTLVIVNRDHLALARPQVNSIPASNLLVQPRNCDTGPGLLYALIEIYRRAGDVALAVFPSDHFLDDGDRFNVHVQEAERLLRRRPDRVVLLGFPSRRPDSSLGYIELGPRLPGFANGFAVERFREKPTALTTESLHAAGSLWNSFVMVFRVGRMLELIRQAKPDEYARMEALGREMTLDAIYDELSPWNFSENVLVPMTGQLLAIRVDGVYWNDLGTPQAIDDTLRSWRISSHLEPAEALTRYLAARSAPPADRSRAILPVLATPPSVGQPVRGLDAHLSLDKGLRGGSERAVSG